MKSKSRRQFLKTAATAGVAAATMAAPAIGTAAGKTRTLKLQSSWAAGTPGYKLFDAWCKSMVERTSGEVDFKPFPESAVAGDAVVFDAVRNGVLDGENIFWTRWPSRMPAAVFLTGFPLAPPLPSHWDVAYYSYGLIDIVRELYAKNGLYFVGNVHSDANFLHSKTPVRSLDDLKGKKMRFPGGIIAETFAALGVSTTLLPGSEVYPALEKGTIDATDWVGPAVNYAQGFAQVTKYIIIGPKQAPSMHQAVDAMDIAFSLRVWKSLSPHMQKLIEAETAKYSLEHYTTIMKEDHEVWPKYKAAGNEIIYLPESDLAKLKKVAIPLWFKWANKDKDAARVFKIVLQVMQDPAYNLLDPKDIQGFTLNL
ncbi:MAG TPA: TRAP transporter substrate-binding protein DctP [Candidatus Methylomirabilis sp.]|nr:TRAP transporter substrate-binding protein DctP [Candidatus Methylomirabilis sp.]